MDPTQPVSHGTDLPQSVDELLAAVYPAHEPGAVGMVVRDSEVVFRKAYGMANLELGVSLQPDHIFRIGSITKQFTAVAILLLSAEGKLAVEDEITRFLPSYPTHGHRITIEHLLTHTSGIMSYTNRPDFPQLWRKDVTLAELIGEFEHLPMEFAPGERYNYNNSGYVLLGAIVEAASGQTYEQFLEERIFRPLDLGRTSYDHTDRIVAGRAAGYDVGPRGFQNAAFISMTQPHAAGALTSTVDDLARWNAALFAGRLLSPNLLKRAWTSYRLNDGTPIGYGYGWALGNYAGHRLMYHSGGIPGFHTHAMLLPDDGIFVTVLANSFGKQPSPTHVATKIAALTVGRPYAELEPIVLPNDALDRFVGTYQVRPRDVRNIVREGDQLFFQSGSGPKQEIIPLAENDFFFKNDSFTRIRFDGDGSERARSLEIRGLRPPEVATRTT
jgi:CubicO group peptidase (beta-lactamase class C family)